MLIAIFLIMGVLFIFGLIYVFSKSKKSRNTIKLVHDYLKESCGFLTGSLYCSIEYKVFLSVDEKSEKLCEVTWN